MPADPLDALLAQLARGPDPLTAGWAADLLAGEHAVPVPTASAAAAGAAVKPDVVVSEY
jgi:hypothetical protein